MGYVPQGWGLDLVRLAAGQVAEEGPLGGPLAALVDGGVMLGPVHGQTETAEKGLKGSFVLGGEHVAEVDEVAAADVNLASLLDGRRVAGVVGGGEVWVVGQRRFAAHPEVVLDPPLGGQAVVVPPHRVEDLTSCHALIAGDGVGVGVREHVPDVQGAGNCGRRGVDGEHLGAFSGPVKAVGPPFLPDGVPALLDVLEAGPLGDGGNGSGGRCVGVVHGR